MDKPMATEELNAIRDGKFTHLDGGRVEINATEKVIHMGQLTDAMAELIAERDQLREEVIDQKAMLEGNAEAHASTLYKLTASEERVAVLEGALRPLVHESGEQLTNLNHRRVSAPRFKLAHKNGAAALAASGDGEVLATFSGWAVLVGEPNSAHCLSDEKMSQDDRPVAVIVKERKEE